MTGIRGAELLDGLSPIVLLAYRAITTAARGSPALRHSGWVFESNNLSRNGGRYFPVEPPDQ
jgi:hypothetical protein